MSYTGTGDGVRIEKEEYEQLQKTKILWSIITGAMENHKHVPAVLCFFDADKIDLDDPPQTITDLVSISDIDARNIETIIMHADAEKDKRGPLYLDDCVVSAVEWLDEVTESNPDPRHRMRLATAGAYCLLAMDLVPSEADGEI